MFLAAFFYLTLSFCLRFASPSLTLVLSLSLQKPKPDIIYVFCLPFSWVHLFFYLFICMRSNCVNLDVSESETRLHYHMDKALINKFIIYFVMMIYLYLLLQLTFGERWYALVVVDDSVWVYSAHNFQYWYLLFFAGLEVFVWFMSCVEISQLSWNNIIFSCHTDTLANVCTKMGALAQDKGEFGWIFVLSRFVIAFSVLVFVLVLQLKLDYKYLSKYCLFIAVSSHFLYCLRLPLCEPPNKWDFFRIFL